MERTTILPAAGLLLLVLVLGAVSLPGQTAGMLAVADARAVRCLGEIAVAEMLARSRRQIDRDGDGVGEFGFLAELCAATPAAPPALEVPFEATARGDTLRHGGFLFRVYLPSTDGRPTGPDSAGPVNPGLAAQAFLALAWPEVPDRTGRRTYLVNQSLLILETASGPRPLIAIDGPPPPLQRLWSVDPITGQTILPAPSPAVWSVVLPEAQRTWYRGRFARAGLPEPPETAEPVRKPSGD